MNEANKPGTISRKVSGPIKRIEYFFPRNRAGLRIRRASLSGSTANPRK
jgi:hypothetical protein